MAIEEYVVSTIRGDLTIYPAWIGEAEGLC